MVNSMVKQNNNKQTKKKNIVLRRWLADSQPGLVRSFSVRVRARTLLSMHSQKFILEKFQYAFGFDLSSLSFVSLFPVIFRSFVRFYH